MGIIYNSNKYISEPIWKPTISRRRTVNAITQRNIQFLKRIGLKVVRGGVV